MPLRDSAFGALLFVMLFASLGSAILGARMHEQVNYRLPEGSKIGWFWNYPGKYFKIARLHKQFYPESQIRVANHALIGVMILAGLTLVLFGMFSSQ